MVFNLRQRSPTWQKLQFTEIEKTYRKGNMIIFILFLHEYIDRSVIHEVIMQLSKSKHVSRFVSVLIRLL